MSQINDKAAQAAKVREAGEGTCPKCGAGVMREDLFCPSRQFTACPVFTETARVANEGLRQGQTKADRDEALFDHLVG